MLGRVIIKVSELDELKNKKDKLWNDYHFLLKFHDGIVKDYNARIEAFETRLKAEVYHKAQKERTIKTKISIIEGLKREVNQWIIAANDWKDKFDDMHQDFNNLLEIDDEKVRQLHKKIHSLQGIVRYRTHIIEDFKSGLQVAILIKENHELFNRLSQSKRENYNLNKKIERMKNSLANNMG